MVEVRVLKLGQKVRLKENEIIYEVGIGGRSFTERNSGYLDFNLMGSTLAAHEFCHAMGLSDRYNYWQEVEEIDDAIKVSNDFESVPIVIPGNPDNKYINNEANNLMVLGNEITDYQWNIVFSKGREKIYDQFTFFSQRFKPNDQTWLEASGKAPLNLNDKGEVTSSFRRGASIIGTRYFNARYQIGGQGGKNYWNSTYLDRNTMQRINNSINMLIPYKNGPE